MMIASDEANTIAHSPTTMNIIIWAKLMWIEVPLFSKLPMPTTSVYAFCSTSSSSVAEFHPQKETIL